MRSGINADGCSLGLIKPETLSIPLTLAEKQHLLCENVIAAKLFVDHIDAPFYFGYVYEPHKGATDAKVKGLKIIDVLALFIQHARLNHHSYIKVVLPISREAIDNAIKTYPTIFNDCQIRYNTLSATEELGSGKDIYIDIYNFFPFANTTFRLLMDYAASHHTPLVITGDQSFMETFFTIPDNFIFIYQLLNHKENLLAQIKELAKTSHLMRLEELIRRTEKGVSSELALMDLVIFLKEYEQELYHETNTLASIVRRQPNLTDSLAEVLVACVTKKRLLLQESIAKTVPSDGDELTDGAVSSYSTMF